MSRPKIKTALIGLFAVTAIVVAALSWFAITGMTMLNQNTAEISLNRMPSVMAAKEIETAVASQRLGLARHVLAVNKEQMAKADELVAADAKETETVVAAYEPLIDSAAERDLYEGIKAGLQKYAPLVTELLELSRDNDKEFAKVLFEGDMQVQAAEIVAMIGQLVDMNSKAANDAYEQSIVTYELVFAEIIGLVALAAIVILGAVVFALRGIARPIQLITASMTRLADGDTTSGIPYAGRKDEIGEMASAVAIFRQAALTNIELEADAADQRLRAEAERVRLTAEAEATAKAKLDAATSGFAAGLKRLASGDLSFTLNEPFSPEFEVLRLDLNGAVEQLGDTLRAVAMAAGAIDAGTNEISHGSNDLSRRTEQQAASLEETAAALDEITVNVSNSSKRADEARSVAVQANASAVQSGSVVANAVSAMHRIEEASNQISNIIGVIDEIAFQTNLLALNAGVEAARAGDAGKGFAVVAQEVRELAQRSAKAAKEIKELIRNSAAEVENGVKLVGQTGEVLKTIETHIVTINRHMDSIATSAREQSTGLAEVNTAVNQMDQVTQQNAAMVEETNAASATLAHEASRLRELISQFVLETDHRQSSSQSRRAA